MHSHRPSFDSQDEPQLSAVDHEGAYRTLPVRDPDECAVLVPDGDQAHLWIHNSLPFGATSSVWGYLRFADVLAFLSVALLMLCATHYVDDFFNIEAAATSQQAFWVFQEFHRILGMKMKEAKAKPPAQVNTLLGVLWERRQGVLFAQPGSNRARKVCATIQQILDEGQVSAGQCAKLAGKLQFVGFWRRGPCTPQADLCTPTCWPARSLRTATSVAVIP